MARIDRQKKQNASVIRILNNDQFSFIVDFVGAGFSTVLNTSLEAQGKVPLGDRVKEIAWRHDHDRLLINFFVCKALSEKQSKAAKTRQQKMRLLCNKLYEDSSTRPS